MRGAGAFLGPPLAGFVLDAAGPRTDIANSTIVDDPASIDVVADVSGIIMIREQRNKNISIFQVEGSGLSDEITTMEPPTKEDLAHYEVTLNYMSSFVFFISISFFQIALYISTLLLGISALGHGFAFCVNKVQKNRRKKQFNEA